MQETKEELEKLGATIEEFFRDPKGGHGGFMQQPYTDKALDIADRIIQQA